MDRFCKMLEDPHKYAREWKEKTGGKVIGYMCPYFPEELAYAAGVLPVRILSRPDADGISYRYLYATFCPKSRGVLAQGLNGAYSYLDGISHAQCCEGMSGAYASWRLHIPHEHEYFVSMPSDLDHPWSLTALRSEMEALKKDMEKWTGNTVTEEALDHAIDVYNTSRSLMRQVYELRRVASPKVSGAEAFEMVLTSQIMDKEEHNKLLKDAISKLSGRERKEDGGVRLMMLGSDCDFGDAALTRMIESLGATVVIDRLCNGSNYFWNNIIPQEDRFQAIAQRYWDKPRCAVKDETYRRRVVDIMGLAIDYNVGGVIYNTHRFCTPNHADRVPVLEALKKRFIQFHDLEHDGTFPAGELETRIETFIDMIKK